ncbi:MAG: carboxylesterase/lipase family protein [Ancrocorticia sp.]|uniref:carboxylesterase/lipase family protein n=1 Tax=Ancrocorticia sp. TaxID=2593684 RepID=UPI003F8DA063
MVETQCGLVHGVCRASGSYAFLGIPFAQPPVGDLRFMAPVPAKPWDGVRDATQYGATPQRRALWGDDTAIPEPSFPGDDKLVLNVYTPAPGKPRTKLPVMVWIHGGSYEGGSPSSPWFDGQAFNERSVVTVSISYRVGFDGFGYVDGSDAPLNRGLLDQVLALKWVRDNISQFGGDPGRVTIAGQSAGGGSVLCHLASPLSAGLFVRAIAQSPAIGDRPLSQARMIAAKIAERTGVRPGIEGWRSLTEDQIIDASIGLGEDIVLSPDPVKFACATVEAASFPRDQWAKTLPFGPVFDGSDQFLPASVMAATFRGAGFDVPLLIGCTRHEYTQQTAPMRPIWNRGDDARTVLSKAGFPKLGAWAMLREFPELENDTTKALGQLLTAGAFHLPMLNIVQARASARVASTGDVDTGVTGPAKKAGTWVYEFAWQKPSTGLADHCVEVPFVFNCLADENVKRVFGTSAAPRALATATQNDWVRFIYAGDPAFPAWREGERGRIYGSQSHSGVKSSRPFQIEVSMMRLMREL